MIARLHAWVNGWLTSVSRTVQSWSPRRRYPVTGHENLWAVRRRLMQKAIRELKRQPALLENRRSDEGSP
jgi:hypothetical protein